MNYESSSTITQNFEFTKSIIFDHYTIKLPSFGLRSLCNAYCQCREWLGWWHQFLENLPEPRMHRPTSVFCSWVFWWHLRSPFRFGEWDPDRRYGYSKVVLELPIVKCSFRFPSFTKIFLRGFSWRHWPALEHESKHYPDLADRVPMKMKNWIWLICRC